MEEEGQTNTQKSKKKKKKAVVPVTDGPAMRTRKSIA